MCERVPANDLGVAKVGNPFDRPSSTRLPAWSDPPIAAATRFVISSWARWMGLRAWKATTF
jgi:hypothetical protein